MDNPTRPWEGIAADAVPKLLSDLARGLLTAEEGAQQASDVLKDLPAHKCLCFIGSLPQDVVNLLTVDMLLGSPNEDNEG